jgi:hypothetical protein
VQLREAMRTQSIRSLDLFTLYERLNALAFAIRMHTAGNNHPAALHTEDAHCCHACARKPNRVTGRRELKRTFEWLS